MKKGLQKRKNWKFGQSNMIILNPFHVTGSFYTPLKKFSHIFKGYIKRLVAWNELTLSWRRSLLYRNQFIDLLLKSMDWFLYDSGLRHERVKQKLLHRKLHVKKKENQERRMWVIYKNYFILYSFKIISIPLRSSSFKKLSNLSVNKQFMVLVPFSARPSNGALCTHVGTVFESYTFNRKKTEITRNEVELLIKHSWCKIGKFLVIVKVP